MRASERVRKCVSLPVSIILSIFLNYTTPSHASFIFPSLSLSLYLSLSFSLSHSLFFSRTQSLLLSLSLCFSPLLAPFLNPSHTLFHPSLHFSLSFFSSFGLVSSRRFVSYAFLDNHHFLGIMKRLFLLLDGGQKFLLHGLVISGSNT